MSTSFHLKYRPRTFDQVIGHEAAVTRMRGMVKSGKLPNALLITGPSSAGKTTLARCFASAINGVANVEGHPDYTEHNAGTNRTIDEVRGWIQGAKFRPQTKKKIICIDEAQGLLSNQPAATALLKPLEEPAKDTIWILCSMDPTKFGTGNGKAMANRCIQFALEPHSAKNLFQQALRIAKAEKMTYVLDEERTALKTVVRNCNGEMRTVANLVESLQQYYEGLDKKPKLLTADHVNEVISSTESSDDRLAIQMLTNIYALQFAQVQRSILDIKDSFMFTSKLLYLNTYLLNSTVLKGERHPKVWANTNNRQLVTNLKDVPTSLGMIAHVNATLVDTKASAQTFANDAEHLLSAKLYRLITELKALRPQVKA